MNVTSRVVSRALAAVLAVGLAAAVGERGRAQSGVRTWMDYGGDPANSRHMALDQINKSNLDQLSVAWTYPTHDTISYVFNPVVSDNVMYVLARNNSLVAIDATIGKEIWIHEGLQGIAPRGINYWESKDRSDRRLLFQMNSYLQAIDARTGKPITTFGKDGAVNLREGLGRDPATIVKTQSSNPGKIFENLIILGSAAGENYMAPPGDLRAYDVITGKLVWQFHTIPHPGEFGYDTWPRDAWKYIGGVNTWGELTIDPVRGIAYFPLGSPTYDFYGADRPGANLYGSSLLALNARTGKRLWHFQMVHHDLWDYDNTAAPQLATIRRNGKTIDVVAQAGKTGFLYVFDRVTGEPIWPIEERPVPQTDVPGERSWPTQPFPTAPPPFAPQALTPDDINPYILTPEERATWQKRIAEAVNKGLFTPPSLKDTVSIPGAQGGANWGCTASDPERGIVYVLSINVPSIYKLSTEAPVPGGGRAGGPAAIAQGRSIFERRCQTCHGADLRGSGNYPSLVDITSRLGPQPLREVVTGGAPGMPASNDLSQTDLEALIAFLGNPGGSANVPGASGRGVPPPMPPGPVVASGGAPGGRSFPPGRAGGMVGPPYPAGLEVPEVRMYTGYGMNGTIVKPPYSTLTAYDLNTGTIKWQVPAGGDDPRAVAEGATNTGYISARTGIVTTSAGLLFHAGGDGKLRIYDSETGRVLSVMPLPAGSRGIPAMYEANGRQYFVVNATSPIEGSQNSDSLQRAYVAFALREPAASKNFAPDETFTGSTLAGWRTIGDAKWRVENGEIVATPGAGGWLMLDRAYQDVAVFASLRCAAGCRTGVLLRAEKTAEGGMKGIFLSVGEGDLASYRVTLDTRGVETSREPLRFPGGGQLRVAPPPPENPPPVGARGGGPSAPLPMPGGMASPIPRPDARLRPDDWNTLEVILDANILRAALNDAGGFRDSVAEPAYGNYGPFAFYAGGTAEVRLKNVSYKDLQPRVAQAENVSSRFRMQQLNEFYYSWGPAVADINKDGSPDIVAGPYYYLGPTYSVAREIYMAATIDPGSQYFNGLQYAYDFTGDGWVDVLNSLFNRPAVLYVNPKGESRRWDSHTVTDQMTCEFMLMKDMDADGTLDFVFKDSSNAFVYAKPDRSNPTGMWVKHAISEPGPWANHGMGAGDLNGDGRVDFLNAFGWWEQPANAGVKSPWTYHPAAFGKWTRSSPGGAEMAVYDVNGDGLNDVVTSLQAHGWGLSWFEQKKDAGGRTFVEHRIMGDFSTKNAGNVTFSQLHGATHADVDGDGLQDFVTGKRFWSHLDTFIDPDPHGAPVLYVYRTVRNPNAPGGAEFVPELVHNRSGVGSHVSVVDLDGDRRPEIITSTKRGTFVFWNQWHADR